MSNNIYSPRTRNEYVYHETVHNNGDIDMGKNDMGKNDIHNNKCLLISISDGLQFLDFHGRIKKKEGPMSPQSLLKKAGAFDDQMMNLDILNKDSIDNSITKIEIIADMFGVGIMFYSKPSSSENIYFALTIRAQNIKKDLFNVIKIYNSNSIHFECIVNIQEPVHEEIVRTGSALQNLAKDVRTILNMVEYTGSYTGDELKIIAGIRTKLNDPNEKKIENDLSKETLTSVDQLLYNKKYDELLNLVEKYGSEEDKSKKR